jgi:DNA-binding HxlR family transcriptional regulator
MKPAHSDCPIAIAAAIVGDLWTILILRELQPGPRRFKDLFTGINGISTRTLTHRLRKLEGEEMVVKERFKEAPPRIQYSLSDKGKAALPLLDHLKTFGEQIAN